MSLPNPHPVIRPAITEFVTVTIRRSPESIADSAGREAGWAFRALEAEYDGMQRFGIVLADPRAWRDARLRAWFQPTFVSGIDRALYA